MDKTKALDAALSQIERAFGKGSIMRLGKNQKVVEIETVPTGSLGLDIALGVGGLPRGRVVEIYGPEWSGKTTLTLHVIAEAQKKRMCSRCVLDQMLKPIEKCSMNSSAGRSGSQQFSSCQSPASVIFGPAQH